MIGLLVNIIILAIVFGLIWWAVSLLPIPQPFRNVVNVALILILILVLLSFLGVFGTPYHFYYH